jgi:hypothetical protein
VDDLKLDPSMMLDAARRRAARAPARLADRLAGLLDRLTGLLDRTPDERLARLMRSPARKPILEAIFWQMPRYLDRERAVGVNAAVLWRITGRPNGTTDDFQLRIADMRASVARGSHGEPAIATMTIDGVDFLRLISGALDPMQAYFGGKIELAGDIMFAAKVGGLFRMPKARPDPLA